MTFTIHAFLAAVGAFLLFLVQPMFAKLLLPWFGGSAGVWAVCLVFFQTVLLLGYLYCHALQYLKKYYQAAIHFIVLAVVGGFFPFLFSHIHKPSGVVEPVAEILVMLTRFLGAPFFLLSTTSVLVQVWQSNAKRTVKTPYELYVFSNIGSLAALLSYPFLIEPLFKLKTQLLVWSAIFILYLAFYGAATLKAYSYSIHRITPKFIPRRWNNAVRTFLLAGLGSASLVSFTTYICEDVAPFPFLWIFPLAIYLLSFVLCFAKKPIYSKEKWIPWMLGTLLLSVAPLGVLYFPLSAGLILISLFFSLMVVHGEMVAAKPPPAQLSLFYIVIATGSAVGSAIVSLLAPIVFSFNVEYPLIVMTLLVVGTCLLVFHSDGIFSWDRNWRIGSLVVLVMIMTLGLGVIDYFQSNENILYRARNFYGSIDVRDRGEWKVLYNGQTIHGAAFNDPRRAMRQPIAYYSQGNGADLIWKKLRAERGALKVGLIGLGTGSFAAYAKEGDRLTYYEINPKVLEVAYDEFPYLRHTAGSVEIIQGDARLSLEKEEPRQYDLMILDAFNSDAIPVHLLTVEAFELYFRHLKPDGFLALHISNRHLDLIQPAFGIAKKLKLHGFFVRHEPAGDPNMYFPSQYAVLSREKFELGGDDEYTQSISLQDMEGEYSSIEWTDQYSSLFPILREPILDTFWSNMKLRAATLLTIYELKSSMRQSQEKWERWEKDQKRRLDEWDREWEKDKKEMEKMKLEN